MKVLIVDDSADSLAIARAHLRKEGVDVVCAYGGKAALTAVKCEAPDLILLDIDMADVSGFDVCRALKDAPQSCMIPIIFLAGSAETEDKIRGLDLGAIDYITKPFDAFELRARVRAALRTKHMQDMLVKYAQIDPLTELFNRRALMNRLRQEWERIRRNGGRVAFIMVDIDEFKRVNDVHGHRAGDSVLREVAAVLTRQRRESDFVARYGGEEFSILCFDCDAEGASRLAQRCRRDIEHISVNGRMEAGGVTASFGVADSVGVTSSEELVRKADEALYRAKNAGRNRVVAYTAPVHGTSR